MTNQTQEESGFCPQCGTANARTAAFCAKCGAPLPWAAPKAEPVAPQAVAPVETATVLPPPRMPPPPAMATPPMATPAPPSATAPIVPILDGVKRLWAVLFPRELLTAYKGATPQELLRLYGLRLVGLVLLVLVAKSFADTIFDLLILGALVSLLVGLKDPEKFRFLFGAKTSKSSVGWSFGALLLLLGMIGSSMEPKRENTNPAPVVAPVTAQESPSAPVKKTAAQVRADAAKERAARAQAKAQRELAKKVAEQKQAERDAALVTQAKAKAKVKAEADKASTSNLDTNASQVGAPKVDFLGTHDVQAKVAVQEAGLVVTNLDTFAYRQVSVILNDTGIFGGFTFETPQIAPGERVEIPFGDFVTRKDARRFAPDQYKLERVLLRCKTDYGIGIGSWPVD